MCNHPFKKLIILLTTLLIGLPASAAEPVATTKPRLSTSTFQGTTTKNHYTGTELRSNALQNKRTVQNHDHGLWIFDVFINLTTDIDYDGHYSSFTVSLDIESDFSPQTVYAVLYLRQNHGQWFEYAVTGNFTVAGNGPQDSVVIEATLDSGYPNGYYDHYVEIYDAYDHSLLITYGPDQSSHVHNIPFESHHYDNWVTSASVRVSFSGTGSLTLNSLLFFIGLIGAGHLTRSNRLLR